MAVSFIGYDYYFRRKEQKMSNYYDLDIFIFANVNDILNV